MQTVPEFMTQAEFARYMDVSRAAVSQWKKKGILRDDAFSGSGRSAKIVVSVAVDQVRQNRDIGQSLGNGIETRTSVEPPIDTVEAAVPVLGQTEQLHLEPATGARPFVDTVESKLKEAKLAEQERKNRMGAAEEARQQGMLVSADDAREQMTRVASMMLQIFEGSLTDFAAAIASQFKVPQRDVLHLLKSEFRNVRATATQKERARVANLERDTTASIELDA
jgi:DNA-binding XRE family transcriptional regulator